MLCCCCSYCSHLAWSYCLGCQAASHVTIQDVCCTSLNASYDWYVAPDCQLSSACTAQAVLDGIKESPQAGRKRCES